MDATTVAFLVLLGGTNAEHVIEMPNFDECHRAAEFVTHSACLDPDEFDTYLREASTVPMDLRPAVGEATPPGDALARFPSATQRRLRNVLYPLPARAPTIRAGVARKG